MEGTAINRTARILFAFLVCISLGCGSSAEIARLKSVAAQERKAAEAARAEANRAQNEAEAAVSKAASELAEAERLRDEAANLKSDVHATAIRAAEALAAAKAEREAAIAAQEEARLAHGDAAKKVLGAELKLAEATRLRDEADAMEAGAVQKLTAAHKDRRLASEELAAAEEARAFAARCLEEARHERRGLQAEFVTLDRRRAELHREIADAQAIIEQSAVAAAKARETRQAVAQERALLRGQQKNLSASVDALRQELAEAETAIAQIQAAELTRVAAAAKETIMQAAADFASELHHAAISAHRCVLRIFRQRPADGQPVERPLITESGQGGRVERLR